ncbi:hypothetical protein VYU27_010466, partial [Nannochloropsis oceanica]
MKRPSYSDNPVLLRVLNARQFSLKMIANVTYGYCSASFSGRMPMAELADAIVSTGRRTLMHAVEHVHKSPVWQPAQVVYGDTDSLFVCFRGRSTAQALREGKALAQAVTTLNPPGVVLQFEKVYATCVLISKKRYVGQAFEKEEEVEGGEEGGKWGGRFDAKGIEVVRRDGCPLVVKVQEKALRILFETRDLSAVKAYLLRQLAKIQAGRVRLQDFIFAKEVKLGSYKAHPPPSACVALRAMASDPRAVPR